jgi:hypothetical protein
MTCALMVVIGAAAGYGLGIWTMLLPLPGKRRAHRLRAQVLPPVTARVVTRPRRELSR